MAVDKAVDSKALDTMFENIGNAIREKDGTTALITPGNMPAKIRAIQTGWTPLTRRQRPRTSPKERRRMSKGRR